MFSVFRMGPAASERGLCDIDLLDRARKNMPTRKGKIVLKDSIFRFESACFF